VILVRVGDFPNDLLERLSRRTGIPIAPGWLDPAPAFNQNRGQYDSTRLLTALKSGSHETVMGAAACDLFIPVLTFVFGEAEMNGRAAIFSIHRLREEFYGLPPDSGLLEERAVRELRHEAGHLQGLTHCRDWSCVMSPSHSVEGVDSKGERYCTECAKRIEAATNAPPLA
jgi:archaemetzincin